MNNIILENMIRNFGIIHPTKTDVDNEYIDAGCETMIVKRTDGSVYLYDDSTERAIKLPDDCNNMTEAEYRKVLSIRLRDMMWFRRINQRELSELSKINQSTISNYITCKQTMSAYNLYKIATALNCSVDDLKYTY